MSGRIGAVTGLLIVTLIGLGCDDAAPLTVPAVDEGRSLFNATDLSSSQFNVFSCATCHGTAPDATPPIAFSLAGASSRRAWWGGSVRSFFDAVDFCYVYFMRGFPSLDPQSDDARALFEYLVSLGPEVATDPLTLTVVEGIADVGPGDATRGAAVYTRSCATCHGAPHTGVGRLGPLVSIVPEASQEFADELGADPRLVVIEKVRHGQFFGVGGNMPFYPREILDDAALADLLEYLDP